MLDFATRLGLRRAPKPAEIAGYGDAEICDLVVRKTAALRAADRIDDVMSGDLLLPTLLAAGAARGSNVLDFGGAAGLHYFATAQVFPARQWRWAVVELPDMIDRARQLETQSLRFFPSIAMAADWLGSVDLLHANGALQYVTEPERTLAELLATQPLSVLWARTLVAESRQHVTQVAPLRDHGPGPSPQGSSGRLIAHQTIHMRRDAFLAAHTAYRLAWSGPGLFWFVRPA
jgi:putative methyltransferase (TIGR04325 family)